MNKDYTTSGERGVATRLVRAAIAAGYTVSVYNGEEYTVHRSRKARQILAALAGTGEDALVIRDNTGGRLGVLSLIWDNDPTGEELIADHTDNDAMDALYNAAQHGQARSCRFLCQQHERRAEKAGPVMESRLHSALAVAALAIVLAVLAAI